MAVCAETVAWYGKLTAGQMQMLLDNRKCFGFYKMNQTIQNILFSWFGLPYP